MIQRIVFRDKISNPPIPPLLKWGEGGLFTIFTKVGRGGITDKTGLTLVEVLIAMTVALVVFLALMQTALVSIDSNMRNILRDEAVRIAEERMNEARDILFTQTVDNLVSDSGSLSGCDCPSASVFPFTTGSCIERDLKNITSFDFCTNRTVTTLNADNRQVNITIGWKWKEEGYTHRISTIMRRQ